MADSCMVTILSLIVSILGVKVVHKIITTCCWEMSAPSDVIFLLI